MTGNRQTASSATDTSGALAAALDDPVGLIKFLGDPQYRHSRGDPVARSSRHWSGDAHGPQAGGAGPLISSSAHRSQVAAASQDDTPWLPAAGSR